MRQVLTSPELGYYTTRTEVFGEKGDFTTSPEISQVFGELVGIWTVAEWIAQGRRKHNVQLVEVGPGKGTLMDDMLRVCSALFLYDFQHAFFFSGTAMAYCSHFLSQTFRNFKSFASSIEAIYLVEASAALREIQKQRLCGDDAVMEETDIGHKSISKHLNIPVIWVEDIRLLPHGELRSPFIHCSHVYS